MNLIGRCKPRPPSHFIVDRLYPVDRLGINPVLLVPQATATNAVAQICPAQMEPHTFRYIPEHIHDLAIGPRVLMTILVLRLAGGVGLDVESVLKTTAQEVRQALGLPEVVIRLAERPGDGQEDAGRNTASRAVE